MMIEKRTCKLAIENKYGIDIAHLENELIKVTILIGKGTDILEMIWKPLGIDCLNKSGRTLEQFKDIDLRTNRLKNHGDMSLGGWMDAVPHRGVCNGIELTQDNGGISATLPWAYEVMTDSEFVVKLRCFVDLPMVLMHLEKTFTIRKGSPSLFIEESIINNSKFEAQFTWTQHALFSGDFVDENVSVIVPTKTVFQPNMYAKNHEMTGTDLTLYEEPVNRVTCNSGKVYDFNKPLPKDAMDSVFVTFNHLKKGEVEMYNKKLDLSVCLNWDLNVFPYLRSLYKSDGSTIVGLEPGNDLFSDFNFSLKHGTFMTMKPGEAIETWMELKFS